MNADAFRMRDKAISARGAKWQVAGGRPLTGMEIVIVEMYLADVGRMDIAAMLGVSAKTVDTHLIKAKAKLGVRRPMALARLAVSRGWVDWTTSGEG